MTTYDIVLSIALAGVSLAIQHSLPTRGFAWHYVPSRLLLAAQLVMGLALAAGLFWGDDLQHSALLLAGWSVGAVIGVVVSILRPRSRQGACPDVTS